jgi:hypothetical protein
MSSRETDPVGVSTLRDPLSTTLPYVLRDQLGRTPAVKVLVGEILGVGSSAGTVTVDFGDGVGLVLPGWPAVTAAGAAQIGDVAYCLAFADTLMVIAYK